MNRWAHYLRRCLIVCIILLTLIPLSGSEESWAEWRIGGVGPYSPNEIKLMANAVHGEARGEPYIGQVAVASVILNRVQSEKFPNSVPGVIFQPRAFTAVADGQIWLTPNLESQKAVRDAIRGWDPTQETLYYFNPETATSGWIWGRPQVKKIGKHIFCR